ncbi:hypothetical protein BH20ACT11_BH20ACT11_03640 [soil metagenome]
MGEIAVGGLVESSRVGVAGSWKVTAGGLSGDVAGDRWGREELVGEEVRDPSARVGGSSAARESASRDSYRIGESSSARRALARSASSASQGKLVRAAPLLALGGGRPERLIGDNARQIETCTRPRSCCSGEQEGFASSVNSARSSLRSELVVADRGDRGEVQTTGCPRTRSRATHSGYRPELCSRKKVVRRVPKKTTEPGETRKEEAAIGRQRSKLRRFREWGRVRWIRCGQGGRGSRGGWRRSPGWGRRSVGRRRQEERA